MEEEAMIAFNKEHIRLFRFVRWEMDWQTGRIVLVYAFDDGLELQEVIKIPGGPFVLHPARAHAVERAIRLLHFIAGVSYYKAAVPRRIVINRAPIDQQAAQLVTDVYQLGLAEFAYRNQLNMQERFQLPDSVPVGEAVSAVGLRHHALVAIGGGKDSLVTIEALRAAGISQTVAWIGKAPLIQQCAEQTGLPLLQIHRSLAPELAQINHLGAWNGHVPVTAVNSAILTVAALLHDMDHVVFSNERSASVGSTIPCVGEVNHQWSKGWAFEWAFAQYVQHQIAADLQYYSLLRPYSELAVARQFAKIDRYDFHFSSCNRNFHLGGFSPKKRWCGHCPKCHFVFLALAPFMPKQRLLGIFERNLLNEPEQAAAYDALLEYNDHKPFECVGEARESRAAMAQLSHDPAWQSDWIVARFVRDVLPQLEATSVGVQPLLAANGPHRIPQDIWQQIHALFRP